MDSWNKFVVLLLVGSFLISLSSHLISYIWPKQLYPDPAALELIRGMTEDEQRFYQQVATMKGKIEAIKELRARAGVGLKVSKDAIELLQAVEPALLKFS